MTRTLTTFSIFAAALLVAPLAFASGHSYDNDYRYDYDYDYQNYDNSINHSYNSYDSYNDYGSSNYDRYYDDYTYTYGYPYSYAYSDPSSYTNSNYYTSGYRSYDSYSYGYRPTCSISAYNSSGTYRYDSSVTVSWWSSGATSAYLSGVGNVNTSGTQVTYSPYNSTYTLTVYGPGGSTSCSASNPHYYGSQSYTYGNTYHDTYAYPLYNYSNYSTYSYPAYTAYTYPAYSGVGLNQIPYTGFDYGTVGNSLYWLGMILVAALGAYLIVYSHSGAFPRTFAREVTQAARNQLSAIRSIVK